MITRYQGGYCLEVLEDDVAGMEKRFKVYAMRAKVKFEWLDQLNIYAVWNKEDDQPVPSGSFIYIDPRLESLGKRIITETDVNTDAEMHDYDAYRVSLGIPDGSRDMKAELSTLYDGNMDALNAMSLKKGCFLGQELTARMHYRGLIKKRLMTVQSGAAMTAGFINSTEGRMAGEVLSIYDGGHKGLALIKLEHARANLKQPETDAEIRIVPPAYLKL